MRKIRIRIVIAGLTIALMAISTSLYGLTKNEYDLLAAVKAGNVDAVKKTLKKFSKRDDNISAQEDQMGEMGPSAIEAAVALGNSEIVALLIAAKADKDCVLSKTDDAVMFQFLIKSGANPNKCQNIWQPTFSRSIVDKSALNCVKMLLDAGLKTPPPDDLISSAILTDNDELIELLLARKIDVSRMINHRDFENKTPLTVARERKKEWGGKTNPRGQEVDTSMDKIIKMLKNAGANE